MTVTRVRRIWRRTATAVLMTWTVWITAFTVTAVHIVDKTDARLLGYTLTTVLSDSMSGVVEEGDIAVSRTVSPDTLREGDIITYRSVDPDRYGEVMTHKIREVISREGELAFITYGVAAQADDVHPVPARQVIGQYRFRLPEMGRFYRFLKSSAGYVTLIFLPFVLLLLVLGTRFVQRLREMKTAQQAEMATERRKAREMREELERLRRRLDEQDEPPV